uniref:Kazal-like domain-containing protein n=1 Tax=Biomphalaria glabrata TaxID=6526 RepID=A0A2C9JRU8_BIOGL
MKRPFLLLSVVWLLVIQESTTVAQDADDDSRCEVGCDLDTNDLVCGSNNKTYRNECELYAENRCYRRASPYLTVAYPEVCTRSRRCKDSCENGTKPVCGSNLKTYPSACHLYAENLCLQPKNPVYIAYTGECARGRCLFACLYVYDPVCGSNKKTYPSSCELYSENCRLRPNGPFVTIIYPGECDKTPCDIKCSMEYKPICGDDSITYSNKCHLDAKNACNGPDITSVVVSYEDEC